MGKSSEIPLCSHHSDSSRDLLKSRIVTKEGSTSSINPWCCLKVLRNHPRKCITVSLFVITLLVILSLSTTTFCIPKKKSEWGLGRPIDSSFSQVWRTQPKVVLYGDSLVTKTVAYQGLISKIKFYLPNYPFNYVNDALTAYNLMQLRGGVEKLVVSAKPQAVFMLWGTDSSSSKEPYISPYEIAKVRQKYEEDLSYIVQKILATGSRLAIIGPGLLGEKGPFKYLGPDMNRILDAHRAINKKVAAKYNVKYIDIRSAFQYTVPSYRLLSRGCATIDGEHPNAFGADILAKFMADALYEWFGPSSSYQP